jgi:hypothetical protein
VSDPSPPASSERWPRTPNCDGSPSTATPDGCSTTAVAPTEFPAALAAHVNATWVTSAAPDSITLATRCDQDHTVAFPEGRTCPTNLAPFDRRWHNAKTHAGVRVHHNPDGTLTVTTPLGQTTTTDPWDYRLGP